MENNTYISDDELMHWGVLGMKWGVRRYQNKDGSLTAAGKKRRAQLEADLKTREKHIRNQERNKAANEKLAAKAAELDEREKVLRGEIQPKKPSRSKTVSDMTDDELRTETNRMMLETNYLNAQKNLAIANPPKVSAGQKFAKSLMNDVIAPAAKNAGRAWVENFMKEKLGLNKQDPIAKLEKQIKKLELKNKLDELTKKGSVDDIEDLLSKYGDMDDATRDRYKNAAMVKGWERTLRGQNNKDK